ncbi:efflux RND transporter periplasmic adaptor subunit [Comamonas sp. JUb58]|uniref:efflux RND transporter periplasmic adaptor subunit n=1 Tax=Comamonas sp. JUb58 TaxID=2485114 RepID=UPI00105E8252|nr:efflux RND transporter periplasmic adaptor subunit [Comamonas sp. JUb58]TDS84470.1 cobalt-zinc-cadmium efflux system membrane fusion protein [Comamonas sp. JUb58]
MSEKTRFDSSLSASKQWIAAALIAAAGVAGGAYLLRGPGSAAAAPASGHADAPSHKDGEHHGEAAAKTGAKAGAQADAHQEADQHGDGEHHDDKAEAGSKDAHGAAAGGHAEGEAAGEGLVKLSPAQAKAAGVVVAQAGRASIKKQVLLPGEIRFDEDRTAHVVPRVAGVVASVHAQLGEQVAKGQLLAVIQSSAVSDQRSELQTAQRRLAFAKRNHEREKQLWQERISAEQDYQAAQQALQEAEIAVANAAQKLSAIGAGAGADAGTGGSSRYELRAPLAGMVVEKHLTVGESVTDSTASFTVSDLRSVWAEISVAAPQLPDVRMGAPVVVRATAFDSQAEGRIAYVGALIGAQTRTAPARVALANPQGVWRPGLFVDVELLAGESPVPIAVDAKAIQRPDGKESVVFVPAEGGYQAQVVQLGATDGKTTEVTSGLKAGQRYVKEGSFMLRAELGKASAEHAH